MAWSTSTRKEQLPDEWPTIRRRILARDRYMCQHIREDTGRICGARATDVDHIIPGDDHDDSNLRSLCSWHHDRKSSSEGGRAASRARRTRAAKFTDHPGFG